VSICTLYTIFSTMPFFLSPSMHTFPSLSLFSYALLSSLLFPFRFWHSRSCSLPFTFLALVSPPSSRHLLPLVLTLPIQLRTDRKGRRLSTQRAQGQMDMFLDRLHRYHHYCGGRAGRVEALADEEELAWCDVTRSEA
jgi:hypothetical protein